jgi:putative component of toxin-antitoxin plasmid stabilization module
MFGPGYRIYSDRPARRWCCCWWAASKGTQVKDIPRAQQYWLDYLGEK